LRCGRDAVSHRRISRLLASHRFRAGISLPSLHAALLTLAAAA